MKRQLIGSGPAAFHIGHGRVPPLYRHGLGTLDHSRFAQSLAEKDACRRIRNAVHHSKTDKLFNAASVIHLKLKMFIAGIE